MNRKSTLTLLVTGLLLAAFCAADLLLGGSQFADAGALVIGKIRLPRMLNALLAGAGLAIGGLQMQSIFRNPLADPHIMGVSAGAGLGAALATMGAAAGGAMVSSGIANAGIVSAAFAGALACSALILLVSSRTSSTYTLLLFGVMLGFIVSAAVTLLQWGSNAESLKLYYSWAAGSFSNAGWEGAAAIGTASLAGLLLCLFNCKGLDLILFGDEYTRLSGANVQLIRFLSLASCSLIAGTATAFCGPLGFVGIAAPHIVRGLSGTSLHRILIPGTLLTGAALAVCADLLSQIWSTPLPAGSILAIIGIPVILYILIKK